MSLRNALDARARALGFDAVGVADASAAWECGARLEEFIAEGRHGDMDWLAREAPRRSHPQALWPQAQSAVMLGLSYAPSFDPLSLLEDRTNGVVSAYAARRDYHDVIKGRLKELGQWLALESGAAVKVFVDTAPLMEKPLAQRAGLGWQGKHTNLVSRAHGSWLLLGAILTAAPLPSDAAEDDHCGSCRACLDVCPTGAFPAPYQLDARRCIAYLTIEHAGPIPDAFRAAMGNRVFGCDDCLAVCPWNKFAAEARDAKMAIREDLTAPALADLAALDETGFRARFQGTPVKRTGRARVLRNVMIAIGNSQTPALAASAERALSEESPLIRGAAVWALRRLDPERFARLKQQHADTERDPQVHGEWA
jgi:epoxyqueuosine reductase